MITWHCWLSSGCWLGVSVFIHPSFHTIYDCCVNAPLSRRRVFNHTIVNKNPLSINVNNSWSKIDAVGIENLTIILCWLMGLLGWARGRFRIWKQRVQMWDWGQIILNNTWCVQNKWGTKLTHIRLWEIPWLIVVGASWVPCSTLLR
jgi:hypothetical protein